MAIAGSNCPEQGRDRTVIDHFVGEYRFLSNFWPTIVHLDGRAYRSVEHAYQAAKTSDDGQRRYIQEQCSKPGDAKRYGRRVTMRFDWNDVKLDIMLSLLRQKFAESFMRNKLIATDDAELIEGNDWGDHFWGKCMGIGENHLGRLLMQVRSEINSVHH